MSLIKRVISCGLAIVMAAGLMNGCGQTFKDEDIITLRWVTPENGPATDLDIVLAEANEYTKNKIGVTINLDFTDSQNLNRIMESGEYYDMIFSSDWLNRYDPNAAAGKFYDITDMIQSETPDLYNKIGEYWEAATVGGHIYGVPTLKDMGTEMMFRFNKDYYIDEKGMEIPEEMDFSDVERYLEIYKADFPDKYPLGITKTGPAGFTNFLERVIGTIIFIPYEGEVEAIPFWNSEKLMYRYRLMHKWFKAGYIDPNVVDIESENDLPKDVPVRFGVAWRGYLGYSNPDDWGFNVAISFFDGPYISRKTEQGALIAINSECDEAHVRAALKYIELLNTDRKLRDMLAYGIEGTHFRYIENGTVLQLKNGLDNYNPGLYNTGSVVNASVVSASERVLADPDLWEKVFEGYKTNGIFGKTEGFVYDQTETVEIVDTIMDIFDKYSTMLRTGAADPDVIVPEIREEMEAAGINELLDDINSQLKTHLESIEK